MPGFRWSGSAAGVLAAGRQTALGAEAKRSSPPVSQMEISGLRFDSALRDGTFAVAAAAGRITSGTTAAANPKAESSIKLLREVWFVVGVSSDNCLWC